MHALAVDVGGTKLDTAIVDAAGRVLPGSRHRQPTGPRATPTSLAEALRAAIINTLAALPESISLAGVGIGSAGPVDITLGTISPLNIPGIRDFDIVAAVRTILTSTGEPAITPIVLRLDAAALALAESWLGATKGARSSLAIVVSTGVGGGFILDGRLYTGATGNAGHLGQLRAWDEPMTVEEAAAGPGSVDWARAHGWHGTSGEDLARDAAASDSVARAAIERSARVIGEALADASTLTELEVVAIGGGFSRASGDYVDLVADVLRAAARHRFVAATRVVASELGDEGPLVGAAALVLR